MIKNAFAYVTRKSLKSIIILLVITAMSTLCLISLSIKDATNRASKETFGNITNSFSMEINRRVNFGTPRGGGNIKGQDIKKIAESKDIDSYVKRINSVADLVDNDIIETQKTLSGQSPERAKNFKRAVMLTGVNDSSKENKFISGAYKLSSGEHLNENDKNKILMHKDLAEKNNLKIGDKIKIKSNYDGKTYEKIKATSFEDFVILDENDELFRYSRLSREGNVIHAGEDGVYGFGYIGTIIGYKSIDEFKGDINKNNDGRFKIQER